MKSAASKRLGGARPPRGSQSSKAQVLSFHDNISYRVTTLYLLMVKATANVYASEELNSHEWKIMSVLHHYGPMPATEVRKWSTLDKATISRTVRSLLQKKLVSRQLNETDARSADIELTEVGRETYLRMAGKVVVLQQRLFEDLSADDEQRLFRILDNIEQRLRLPAIGEFS